MKGDNVVHFPPPPPPSSEDIRMAAVKKFLRERLSPEDWLELNQMLSMPLLDEDI